MKLNRQSLIQEISKFAREWNCENLLKNYEIQFGKNKKKKYLTQMNMDELNQVHENLGNLYHKIMADRQAIEDLKNSLLIEADLIPDTEEGEGYKKLKEAVHRDLKSNEAAIFNPNGCNKCIKYCSHNPCDKFKWIIQRAKHYQIKTGIPYMKLLDIWEQERNYWYQNYYQDCSYPLIIDNKVSIFDTKEDFKKSLNEKGFRCPKCEKESTSPTNCENDNNDNCDWSSYGLFGTLGKGTTVFIKDVGVPVEIFMPVAWENKNDIENLKLR